MNDKSERIKQALQLLDEAGQIDTDFLDSLVHDIASRQASAVNNGGSQEQVIYMVKHLGPGTIDTIRLRIKEL